MFIIIIIQALEQSRGKATDSWQALLITLSLVRNTNHCVVVIPLQVCTTVSVGAHVDALTTKDRRHCITCSNLVTPYCRASQRILLFCPHYFAAL